MQVLGVFDVKSPGIGVCVGIMLVMALAFRVLAYVALRKRDKPSFRFEDERTER